MPGFWGESAQSMEKSSPWECGLALMPAVALTGVYPQPVMAPPWASGSSPVKWGSPSCCEEEAPGSWKALRAACRLPVPAIVQAHLLCVPTSLCLGHQRNCCLVKRLVLEFLGQAGMLLLSLLLGTPRRTVWREEQWPGVFLAGTGQGPSEERTESRASSPLPTHPPPARTMRGLDRDCEAEWGWPGDLWLGP